MKSKSILGKLIYVCDKNDTDINISFVSHQDVRLNIIKKGNKSSVLKDKDNKELTLLLSDIKSHFKQNGVPLNITEGDSEKTKIVITGQKPGKASLSEVEIALQKMQLQAQKLGAEMVLTNRPDIMAEAPWVLPEISPQGSRSTDIPAGEGLAKLSAAIKTVADKCSLQIELMIQPDLRPQVRMNVSAGEINWTFAAREGRYPLKDVLAKMAGKTTTHGWDAVVVYQRGQANNLLKQQHIKRFVTGNTLAPVNEDIDSSAATRLLTQNLTLSKPHLSFNKAGSGDATAQVAMDFIKGMIVYKQEMGNNTYRIMRIEKITPLNSPFVAMDVPLSKAPGSVSDVGEVQFDIKEGSHFTNNLVANGMEQETISNFFKRRFDATQADKRIYKLGTISNYENEQFQPEKFDIRTMGAPNTASRGSQDEGDGAVVLFVQMKGSDAIPVEKKTDWLLADGYTSALVIGSKHLLDNIRLTDDSGDWIHFIKYPISDNVNSLWGVKPEKSDALLSCGFIREYPFPGIEGLTQYLVTQISDLNFWGSSDVITPYTMHPSYTGTDDNNQFGNIFHTVTTNDRNSMYFHVFLGDDGHFQNKYTIQFTLKVKIDTKFVAGVDTSEGTPGVIVSRVKNDDDTVVEFDNLKIIPEQEHVPVDLKAVKEFALNIIKDKVIPTNKLSFNVFMEHFSLAHINTLTVQNMLFPGKNYFRSEFAFIPGDLLVQGQLAPGSESFAVTPTETTIVAGSVYEFKTTPEVSGVKWSISDSEKGKTGVDLGTIDAATGKYTAPQAKAITEGVRHVVVCAEKGDTKVYALASVVAKGVSVSPAYQVVLPGQEVTLTANSVNGGELKWEMGENKQDSSLTKITNNEYTYKAGKKAAKLNVNLERVTVTDEKGASGEALILIPNSGMSGKITVLNESAGNIYSVKLVYTVVVTKPALDENGDPIYDEDDNQVFEEKEVTLTGSQANWTAVETGGATFDKKTGILTSAPGVGDGFAVIRVAYTEGSNQFRSAVVIPLPLSTYQRTILKAYSPEQE